MPIYEFTCPECKERFEILYRGKGLPEFRKCPKCKTSSPRVLFSKSNFKFSEYLKELGGGNMVNY